MVGARWRDDRDMRREFEVRRLGPRGQGANECDECDKCNECNKMDGSDVVDVVGSHHGDRDAIATSAATAERWSDPGEACVRGRLVAH